MEKVVIFVDLANVERAFRRTGERVDLLGLRDYLAGGRFVLDTFVYVPIDPFNPDRQTFVVEFLQRHGFFVRSKLGKKRPGGRWKANFDVEIALDASRYAATRRPDVVVLACGDGDLTCLVLELRLQGVRCEIATTRAVASENLLAAASGFIDLGEVITQDRSRLADAANDGAPVVAEQHPRIEG